MATVLTKPDEREENELVPWLLLSTHNFSVRYLYYFTLRMKATLPLQIRLTRNLQFHEILIYYFDHFILKKVLFLLLCFFVEGYSFLSIDLRSITEAMNVLPLTFSWTKKGTMNILVPLNVEEKKNSKNLSTKVGLYLMRFCSAYFVLGLPKLSSFPKNGLPPIK